MLSIEEARARCWVEVDLDALKRNYMSARAMIRGSARVIPVLKANAYGLGARVVARALHDLGADMFAVACVSEAIEVKREVPKADVLVMGMTGEAEAARAIEADIILTAHSKRQCEALIAGAKKIGRPARAHVKLETGLYRLGFVFDEAIVAYESEYLRPEGLYTHLALRDEASDRAQLDALRAFAELLRARGTDPGLVHALDSIGLTRYPDDQLGGVRVGAWLYGVCPRRCAHPENCLQPFRLMARISRILTVPAGLCVGYDDEHPLTRDTRVATLSAGYVDGYTRFNNVGEAEIAGKRAPVLGLVCMDQMMVDVTGIPEAREGDAATLIGGGIGVDEYAEWGNLNRNEALARAGRRVPRVYTDNGNVVAIDDYMGAD